MKEKLSNPTHIPVLGHLRGLAALSVCLLRFSNWPKNYLPATDPIRLLGSFGWLGVEAFFVISGFVIPYSLHLRSYRYRDAPDFFLRRLKRLEPPYFACIALTLAVGLLASMAPGYRGEPLNISAPQLLAHIAYLNAILGYEWVNGVFWTLAIEFQFYIFMALCFPWLAHRKLSIRVVSILCVAVLGLIGPIGGGNSPFLPHWLPLFAIGMLTYLVYTHQVTRRMFVILLGPVMVTSCIIVGVPHTIVGSITAATILALGTRELPRVLTPFAFVGTISYSLYLVHTPIGSRVTNLATRLPETVFYRYSALVAAFAISIGCAYCFWYLIERPSHAWAKAPADEPCLPRNNVAVPVPEPQSDVDTKPSEQLTHIEKR